MKNKLLKIKPYIKGFQPLNKKNIKLNTNENSYYSNLKIIKQILKEIKFFGNKLKFYPDGDSDIIKREISRYYNINKNKIAISNGSDEILANIFITFLKSKKKLYLIDITYSFYESFIKLYKINYKLIKLNKNFSINIKKIKKNNNILINNPNAPVGKSLNNLEIKVILKNFKSLIIIDETYIDFEENSFIKLIKNIKNVLIVQTFSKSKSLAGLRIGFLITNKNLIKKIESVKNSLNSYPVSIISQISVKNIIKNNSHFEKIKNKIIENKMYLISKLKKLKFKIIKSNTNFILTTNKNININKLLKFLNKKNIFLRKFEIPKIENYLRITIGKKKEIKIINKNIKNFIKFLIKKN
ncbi:histidinol-phosphate transaminase [Candidatus Nasuia deltocephalinicola]|uniref:Histidinol-phosphate transaminase n=1 Tax=Candidatus Nasuia deltocephalincola TaxID=1160784 RepID=A0A974WKK2_9PROT|nr:histidinol-phosphate transaminase [Candidatus Nasuia deltocephalinicola]